MKKLNQSQRAVLKALCEASQDPEHSILYYKGICHRAHLTHAQAKRATRALACLGLVKHQVAWNGDDGWVAGSGYEITLEGITFIRQGGLADG